MQYMTGGGSAVHDRCGECMAEGADTGQIKGRHRAGQGRHRAGQIQGRAGQGRGGWPGAAAWPS